MIFQNLDANRLKLRNKGGGPRILHLVEPSHFNILSYFLYPLN